MTRNACQKLHASWGQVYITSVLEDSISNLSQRDLLDQVGKGHLRHHGLQRFHIFCIKNSGKRSNYRLLGPGTYNIKDSIQLNTEKPHSTRGVCETREARFRGAAHAISKVPGPGTYGKGGIPNAVLEEKERKSTSNVGMLDSGKSYQRQLPEVGSHLCPGQYETKSFTDELAERVVSKRGPYDLFTGERNKPVTTGFFAVPARNKINLGPGEYDLKSFLHELKNRHKGLHGKFLKVERFPSVPKERIYSCTLSQYPRNPSDPGPGSYSPQFLGKPEAAQRPGFGSSNERMDRQARRNFLGSSNPVGPGRYNLHRYDNAQHVNDHGSAFNSKTRRYDLIRDKFMMERIRPKDVRPKDKVFMVAVDAH